jgi:hypothetical protein
MEKLATANGSMPGKSFVHWSCLAPYWLWHVVYRTDSTKEYDGTVCTYTHSCIPQGTMARGRGGVGLFTTSQIVTIQEVDSLQYPTEASATRNLPSAAHVSQDPPCLPLLA